MNIYQCERWAQDNGFDSCEFYANFPSGKHKCRWLDAYFGMFEVPGVMEGFVMVRQIDEMFPSLVCEPITEGDE